MKNLLIAVAYIILAPIIGGLLSGFDRVLTARMQGRKGPSPLQPFYDVKKLFSKELFVVNHMQGVLIISHLVLVVLTGIMLYQGHGLLLTFFVSATAAMFFVLAGGSTDSPYPALGTQREMLQMMCAEPIELLTAVGLYMFCGSFSAKDVISSGVPAIVALPGVFIAFIFVLTIKMRKSPFDLSTSHHAHQELVKGITTEMTASYLAIVEVAEWYENVFLLSVVALFFIGNGAAGIVWGVLAALVVWFLEILVDNTSARISWQNTFKLSWLVTLILSGLNLLVLNLLNAGGIF